jgi:TonB family protein
MEFLDAVYPATSPSSCRGRLLSVRPVLRRAALGCVLALTVGTAQAQDKIEVVFVKYNLQQDNRKLAVVKNDPVKAGENNVVILTLFNSGSNDYRNLTVRPVSKDRYLNVRMQDNTVGHIPVDVFRAEQVRAFAEWPVVITVAPTCPDAYMGTIYLFIEGEGYAREVRQFVVEVSNQGILSSSPERFRELYDALGVRPPPDPGEAPPPPEEPPPPQGKVAEKKGRDSYSINKTIKGYEMEVFYCYQQQLRKMPDLEGKVIVSMTIRPWGDCTNVKVTKSTIHNKDVESCLVRRIATWKFPTIATSNGSLDVTYPFIFENKKENKKVKAKKKK